MKNKAVRKRTALFLYKLSLLIRLLYRLPRLIIRATIFPESANYYPVQMTNLNRIVHSFVRAIIAEMGGEEIQVVYF